MKEPLPPPVQQACERYAKVVAVSDTDWTYEAKISANYKTYDLPPWKDAGYLADAIDKDADVIARHFLRAAGFLGDEKDD